MDLGQGDGEGEGGDRDVEEEDRAPADLVGEQAADQGADGVSEPCDAEDQTAGEGGALGGNGGEGHAEDRRPHETATDSHSDAHRDQLLSVLGEASKQREAGEDRGADEEDPAPAEHVGQASAGDEHHAEGERVGVDRPLDRADVDVEVLLDRRQRHVEGGEVVGDHEHAEAHREKRHSCSRLDLPTL